MKHRKIIPFKINENKYTIHCFLGNMIIEKNSSEWKLYCHSSDAYTLSLIKEFKNGDFEEIKYKSLNQVLQSIEKCCNMYFENKFKFFYEYDSKDKKEML